MGRQPSLGAAKADAGGSINSILEMAEGDFTRMLAEAETHENQAVEAYRKLAEEDDFAKQTKLTTVGGKQSEVQSLEVPLNHYLEDRVAVPAVKASKQADGAEDTAETKAAPDEDRKPLGNLKTTRETVDKDAALLTDLIRVTCKLRKRIFHLGIFMA